MSGIFGNYASFSLDQERATKYISNKLRGVLKVGVEAWVDEFKNTVPVWSGGERAAITQIADYAGVPVFGPGSVSRVSHDTPRGDLSPKINKAARQAEGRASETFSVQEDAIKTGKLFFRWNSNLPYFNVNERVDARIFGFRLLDPGPYLIRTRGIEAFKRAVVQELRLNPFRVKNLFRIRRFKVG